MSKEIPDKITFQVTVAQLTLSSRLCNQDIRVTVRVGDVSKITCSGKQSEDGLVVTWNHPFLFTALPSMPIRVTICSLPELAPGWNKQLLGNQVVTNVTSLLESGNGWQRNVLGLPVGPATLSMICRACEVLATSDGHDCVSALRKYDRRLYKFSHQFKNLPCLSTKIELGLARLDLCPLGHADHTDVLRNLAHSFEFHYDQGGSISGLNQAIEIKQARLDHCPLGHLDHADALSELAVSLQKHYRIQKNEADLNRIIEMQERCLDLCPSDHPGHIDALGGLATSLWECYCMQKDVADLNRSIDMDEKRLVLCPEGHSQYGEALGNLASSIKARFHKQHNLADLNRAIDLQEKKLVLRPPGHRSHGIAVQNLALSLKDRYSKMKHHSDLTRAIDLFKQALDTHQVQHHDFAFIAHELAASILLSFKFSQGCYPPDQSHTLPDEAFGYYKLLKKCAPAVSLDLWKGTLAWVKNAEEYNHPSALEAYKTALNTLDHFTSFNSSLDSRHEMMQRRVADLANNAFSCATRHGEFQLAVELLEQGRGILWNQLARFDTSITALEGRGDAGRELGHRFSRLSIDLQKHAEGSAGKGKDPYWRVLEEWQSVVDKIRHVGLSRFLLPPRFEDLQEAAECGPVIIVNASIYECAALIVLRNRPPVRVPLPCSYDDAIQLCSQLSELTRDPHAYGDNRESWIKQMLRELWSFVVEPIVSVLQNDVQLPLGSRIWWCPTSKFTILPFHAAGPHRKAGSLKHKNLMDLYVSSYAPSLSALIRARNRIRSQKESRAASGTANMISFAAVGQARPSTETKLCQLPEVEQEIEQIHNETSMLRNVKFETVTGAAATIEGAVQAFRDHHWVHLACHGAQHAEKPFESWFAMGDGKLTLMRIIQERYTNSEFAFLSACHTAVGDRLTPDEVLHLAAGMQFAGFNGVIGTLWRVDDAVAHQVVTRFYKEMFKRPVLDFEHAAEALNVAVVESASEVSLEKRVVFVHIGI